MIQETSTVPLTKSANQREVRRILNMPSELADRNNSINETNETAKNITVAKSNLSIIFISVPNSWRPLINLEFEKAGIKEKHENNKAVAIAANAKAPLIASLKFSITDGDNLK